MSSICLSVDEVREITGRKRPTSQLAALLDMRIPARPRPDRSICVMRADLTAAPAISRRKKETTEPDFTSLQHGAT